MGQFQRLRRAALLPHLQPGDTERTGKFIRRYLPQLAGLSNAAIHAPWLASPVELEAAGIKLGETYPRPVVDHAEAREKTLQRYGVARAKALQK
jgi:deoxyribodipyrimidine photo-lyase